MTPARDPIRLFGTTFQNPILLAAGTAGFGRELADVVDLERLGGIVTKSVSPAPRAGHPPPRVAEFAAGMLNAVGLANPGLEVAAERELPWLARHTRRARVLVSVVGGTVDEFVTVVRRLDAHDVVTAFELNVSCPNTSRGGEEFSADQRILSDLVARCREAGTKPLIVKLPPVLPDLPGAVLAAERAGADGVALVNTLPGTLYREGGVARGRESRLGFGQGGVSGPALLPAGVLATRRARERTDLPIIGVGGVCTIDDVYQYLAAGANLVAVGTAGLAHPRLPERLAARWNRGG